MMAPAASSRQQQNQKHYDVEAAAAGGGGNSHDNDNNHNRQSTNNIQHGPITTTPSLPSAPTTTTAAASSSTSIGSSNNNNNNALLEDWSNRLKDTLDNNVSNKLKTLILAGSKSKAAMACLLYSACSILMVLSNKNLATANIDLNLLIVWFQAFFAVICVEACKKLKIVEHYNGSDIKTAVRWAPVNVFFCCMLFSGMASLQHNSVPMVTVFKNVTNIVTAIGDYSFFGNNTNDPLIVASFAVTLVGAVFAAKNDIAATPVGLFWMVFNCLSTSGYVLYMKHATNSVKLSKFGMVYYNNLLCVVFLLPLSSGQMAAFLNARECHTWAYAFKNVFAGFLGFFLNFASLNCVSQTGPTTYAVIGSLNKVPLTFLGYYLFDSIITPQAWFFIVVSLCGGFLYSYAKIMNNNKNTTAATNNNNNKNNNKKNTDGDDNNNHHFLEKKEPIKK